VGEAALKEAVTEDISGEVKSPRRLRLPWSRKERNAAAPTTDTPDVVEEEAEPSPLAYKTFSPKLAPGLTTIGGVLAILGGLGAWVRATEVQSEGLAAQQVAVQMGYNDPEGVTIAVFGALAILTALFWLRRKPVFKVVPAFVLKLVPLLSALGIIGLAVWQLPLIDRNAQALAAQAIQEANFVNYHAGLGWGAWCLVVSCVTLFLAVAIGILRELDLRRASKKGEAAE
jgi:uncharacterized membrane protein